VQIAAQALITTKCQLLKSVKRFKCKKEMELINRGYDNRREGEKIIYISSI